MTKNELLNMFVTESNNYFKKHENDLIASLDYVDEEYINFNNSNKIFDRLITCYCANLIEDIKWLMEDDDEYFEKQEFK